MGIDVYASWPDMRIWDRVQMYQGAHPGYLRESYHGDPYPSHCLLEEAFDGVEEGEQTAREIASNALMAVLRQPDDVIATTPMPPGGSLYYGVPMPAAVLRARLPETLRLAIQRVQQIYHGTIQEQDEACREYTEFVELCEAKEREHGVPVRIIVSY